MENLTHELLGVKMSLEEFDKLMCEQNKGKRLSNIDNKVFAIDYQPDNSDLKQKRLYQLENWFNSYFEKQLIQSMWQKDFTTSHDTYFNKDYSTIDELKTQGEIVRAEIKQLRKEISII